MPSTSAQDPRHSRPPAAASVHAVLAACAAARTVSTPPVAPPSGGRGEHPQQPSADGDHPGRAPAPHAPDRARTADRDAA